MAEHKADTYNMFKSLIKHFPEYNEVLSLDIITNNNEADPKNSSAKDKRKSLTIK